MWARVIEILGFEQAELLRREFKGELLQVPKKLPAEIVLQLDRQLVMQARYDEIKEKYGLSRMTAYRYRQIAKKHGL